MSRKVVRRVAMPLLALSGLAAVAAGIWALIAGGSISTTLPLGLPWLPWHLRLDALSGLFLMIIGLVTTAVGIYGRSYVRDFEHGRDSLTALGVFTGLFLVGMLLVVLADDAFLFMVAWELMSLSSYFLVAFQHENAANRRAAFLYLLMAHVGGLAILLGFGVLAAFGHGFDFDALRAAALSPAWASVAFALAFFGFGMKAGLVPLHAWLPEAHPVAPSHISALMSGVMLKVAVYGFIRVVFDLIGQLQWEWGVTPAGDRQRLRAHGGAVRAHADGSQAAAGLFVGGEPRHHLHRAGSVAGLSRHRACPAGRARPDRRALSRPSIMRSSRVCCSWARAPSCTARTSAIWSRWAVCCGACPGPAPFS